MRKIALLLFITLLALVSESPAQQTIGGSARIQPKSNVVCLTGPPGETIAAINVREGEHVKKGMQLVIFQSNGSLQREVALAELALKEAVELGGKIIKLQQLKVDEIRESGSKAIALQELRVAMAKSDVEYTARRQKRFANVGGEDLSYQETDNREHQARNARLSLEIASRELDRIKAARDMNLKAALQEFDNLTLNHEISSNRASQQLELSRQKLAQSVIVAPMDGTVLEIVQAVGEQAGVGAPCLKMANLDEMYAVAEIYESDVLKLKPGQKAEISGKALPHPLTGTVESIGRIITEPSKIAYVKVRLDDPKPASDLINMEVNVVIKP